MPARRHDRSPERRHEPPWPRHAPRPRGPLPRRRSPLGRRLLGLGQLLGESRFQQPDRLAPEREALGGALKTVARAERRLPSAGRVGQLVLGAAALLEERLQALLRAPLRDRGRVAALLRRGVPLCHLGEVEIGDPRTEARDLDPELLGPLGCGRLQSERPEPLPHLGLDVARSLHLDGDTSELQLGAVAAPLELAEPGRLLEQRATVLRPGREHRLDLSLADDRVHGASETHVREQLDEVGAAHGCPVDEVLALTSAHEPPCDRDFAVVELGQAAVLVVECELDLTVLGRRPVAAAGEEDVVGLLRAQLRGGERSRGPDDCVGDVRLAGAVRAYDDGHPRLELDLDRVRKRLEAAQA